MKKNNKIYLSMFGGLGNQMFIYALGRVLMEKYEKKIIFDTSSYKKDNFILEIEDLNAPYFQKTSNIYKIDFKFIKYLQIFPDFIKKILINFFSNGTIKDIEFEKNVDLANFGLRHLTVFNPEIFNKKNIKNYYYGYWQSKFYFEDIKKILLNDFFPKEKIIKKINNINFSNIDSNNVMLHIRGNYFGGNSDRFMKAAGDKYYLNSINFFKDKIINPFFVIFTDDILFAKKTLSKINIKIKYKFINDYKLNSVEEFHLMTKFKNFIVPKSSFSWWAAYLSIEKNKIILIPNHWLIKEKTTEDRITKEMTLISEK